MGEHLGADVQLDAALKYQGLTPVEIWISEAQERMVLAVPAENLSRIRAICDEHDVECCVLGTFGTEGRELILRHGETEVGRMPMALLHDGLPDRVRVASWSPPVAESDAPVHPTPDVSAALPALLAHPNIASKRCIIEQYDHEVQGRSVIRPQVGVHGTGPSDAAVSPAGGWFDQGARHRQRSGDRAACRSVSDGHRRIRRVHSQSDLCRRRSDPDRGAGQLLLARL